MIKIDAQTFDQKQWPRPVAAVGGPAIVDVLRTSGSVQPMPINGNRAVSI